LRSDLHTLFDLGYVTVDPDKLCTVISSRIGEEFENGRDYYRFHRQSLMVPKDSCAIPALLAYTRLTSSSRHSVANKRRIW
jgi:hypothetical protein